MATYDLGDGVNLEHLVYNVDRVLTDATVTLTVTKPDASTTSPTVTHPSTGTYRATVTTDQAGLWLYTWSTSGTITDVAVGAFVVEAPEPRHYTDSATVKRALGKDTANAKDDLVEQAVAAASRMIDERCGRSFLRDSAATARIFPALDRIVTSGSEQTIRVDDFVALATVETQSTFGGAWTAVTGYEPRPDNAAVGDRPYTEIAYRAGWLSESMRVRVTARWGWPSVPDGVAQAAALLAARLYRRKDSPEGVLGSSEWGAVRVSRFDPDVEGLIAPYITIFA